MRRKLQHIPLRTLTRIMILRRHLVLSLLRHQGLQEHIMQEHLDHRMQPLHQAMLQQVHSLHCQLFIASLVDNDCSQ